MRDLVVADPDPASVATALFALSLLPCPDEAIERGLAHRNELVRGAAALALVNLHGEDAAQEARDRVRELLTATGPTPLPYAEGSLATLAARVSRRRLPADAPARAAALIARLAAAEPGKAFPIAGDLLEAVLDEPGVLPDELTGTQREALAAIAGLSEEAWSWLNLWEILRYWGVPDDRDRLAAYLA